MLNRMNEKLKKVYNLYLQTQMTGESELTFFEMFSYTYLYWRGRA